MMEMNLQSGYFLIGKSKGDIMKVRFELSNPGPYECRLRIADWGGEREFLLTKFEEDGSEREPYIEVEIYGDQFEVTVLPEFVDYKSALDEIEQNNWKDKLIKKAVGKIFSAFNDMVFLVACKYHLSNVTDSSVVTVNGQAYMFGLGDRFDLLGLYPVIYTYYEVLSNDCCLKPIDVKGINRKQIVKAARNITLIDFGFHLIFTYPFQVGRVKRLTKDRKIFKFMNKLYSMTPEERQKVFDKQEKDMDRHW